MTEDLERHVPCAGCGRGMDTEDDKTRFLVVIYDQEVPWGQRMMTQAELDASRALYERKKAKRKLGVSPHFSIGAICDPCSELQSEGRSYEDTTDTELDSYAHKLIQYATTRQALGHEGFDVQRVCRFFGWSPLLFHMVVKRAVGTLNDNGLTFQLS